MRRAGVRQHAVERGPDRLQAGIDALAQSVAEGEHIERMGAFVNRKRK